ncbi:MAG: glycosyltransferase family 9 protein [Candidatus Protistobacter heckmanni]|nr:glycosyltransferase family 9 protein [Candidatus Protistobacter heckmanni]
MPNIGLICSSNARFKRDSLRSIAREAFAPIFGLGWIFLIQKEIREKDAAYLHLRPDVLAVLGEELKGFEGTAAVLECMDLVVSVDTAVAHLAGALGRPLYIMLPFMPDWRWRLDKEHTPWYPDATLFRHGEALQWEEPIARIAQGIRSRFPGA